MLEPAMDAVPFDFPATAIPFVVISGEVGGVDHPVRVLFDTGDAAPFQVLVGEHSAAGGQARPTGAPSVTTHATAGGGAAVMTPAVLPTLKFGPISLSGVIAGITPSVDKVSAMLPGGIDLIVGQAFAKGRIVAIDYPARRIDFAARPGPVATALPMLITPKWPFSVIDVTINGKGPFRMALDTGAAMTLLSPQAAKAAGLGETGRAVGLGGAGGSASSGRLETARLEIGPSKFPPTRVVVTDIMGPVAEEAGAQVDGVLSPSLLAKGKLTFDFPGGRLWIELPPEPGPP
jgi:hypothetical protein